MRTSIRSDIGRARMPCLHRECSYRREDEGEEIRRGRVPVLNDPPVLPAGTLSDTCFPVHVPVR